MVLSRASRKKSSVTPPGIDPGTVPLVAQRLNHYTTPGTCLGTHGKYRTRSNAWREQRHMQELWTAGNVAQVQMPEENKDTCRNYGLPQFGKILNLLSSSRPLTHTKFTVHTSTRTFSCVEFGLAYWQHLNLWQKKVTEGWKRIICII